MIEIIKSTISDNYFYLVVSDGEAALIDPVDAMSAIAAVEKSGATLRYVLNTHFHPDHIGGNVDVLKRFPTAMLVAGPDADRIDGVQQKVSDRDEIPLGDHAFVVFETPGHTAGHVSFFWKDGRQHLFSGDTIFVGGAGNCRFGGDAGTLFTTFSTVLEQFDDETVFYPGHDYAKNNLAFAVSIDTTFDYQPWIERASTLAPTIWTIGEEKTFNPFFRYDDLDLQNHIKTTQSDVFQRCREVSANDAEATFRTVRALRNNW